MPFAALFQSNTPHHQHFVLEICSGLFLKALHCRSCSPQDSATVTSAHSELESRPGASRVSTSHLVPQCLRCRLSSHLVSVSREHHMCWLLSPQRSPANHLLYVLQYWVKSHDWLEGRKGRWPFKLNTGPLCTNGHVPLASKTLTGLNTKPLWGLIMTRLMPFLNTIFGIRNATNHPTMTILTQKCTQAHRDSSQLGILMFWGKQRLWECLLLLHQSNSIIKHVSLRLNRQMGRQRVSHRVRLLSSFPPQSSPP